MIYRLLNNIIIQIRSNNLKPCDQNIKMILDLVNQMIRIANKGDLDREDTTCGILYGILRDSAYKIKKLAEEEKSAHQKKGWWIEDGEI
ncbi:MAG: hypothetical protein L6301_16990 [Desulfobacteraceae bacterium]|nr:hypothetical protein [Desulfobacteraceae bacterium]